MKKVLFFVTTLIMAQNVQAFFADEDFSREEVKVSIEAMEGNVHVEIIEKIENVSGNNQSLMIWYPLKETVSNTGFYIDSEAYEFDVLGYEGRLESVFEAATVSRNSKFFSFGQDKFLKLFRSRTISVGVGETINTKIVFDMETDFSEGVSFSEIFLADEVIPKKFELSLVLAAQNEIKHFHTNMHEDAILDRTENQITWFLQKDNYLPTEDLYFFWSETENPVLKSSFLNDEYSGYFVENLEKKKIKEIKVLIDRSGSLYGYSWNKMGEWLKFLFSEIGNEVNIQIVFFDSQVNFYNEKFEKNTFEFQKVFFNFFRSIRPVGKTNIDLVFEEIKESAWTVPKEERMIFLLSDIDYLSPSIQTNESTMVSHFSETFNNGLKNFAEQGGGFYMQLFPNTFELIETDDFIKKWQNLKGQLLRDLEQNNLLPNYFDESSDTYSFFFSERNENPTEKIEQRAKFLPSFWAARRIAQILVSQNFSDENLDAMISIGRVFGIKTAFFDRYTSREDLEKTLENAIDTGDIKHEIWKLNSHHKLPDNDIKFIGDTVLYKEDGVWRTFNFYDKMVEGSQIEIAPFSEAQKKLFLLFPDLVAEGFGISNEVDFCSSWRCISLREGSREESWKEDLAFFKNFNQHHWANRYLLRALGLGFLQPDEEGNMRPDEPIKRGEFAQMIWKWIYRARVPYTGNPDFFIDAGEDSEFFNAVTTLRQKGVVQGYADHSYRPFQNLTRAEGVKMILASLDYWPDENENEDALFLDSIGWEKPWVNEASRRGMVSGMSEKKFAPQGTLTRAQAVKILLESGR